MEEIIYENDMTPEAEAPQQLAENQQPAENQLPVEDKKDFAGMVNMLVEKAKNLIANRGVILEKIKEVPRKVWIMAGAGLAVLIAVVVTLSLLGNTYKTPIQAAEKLLNSKSVEKIIDRAPALLNGFGESEAEKLLKIIKKSDTYKDALEDAEDMFDDAITYIQDEYGDNYKIKIKVEDKEKLEKEDTRAFRDQLREVSDLADELDEMDSDDYEDMADDMGISKSQAKEMVKTLRNFCKLCKSAKVTEGYELSLIIQISGSELDEPEELDFTARVFKVDGRWVPDVFSLLSEFNLGGLYW